MKVPVKPAIAALVAVLAVSAFMLGRYTAPEPQLDIACGRYENETHYRNYCEDAAVPAACQPTGRCGQSAKCPQGSACGYLCLDEVCSLVVFTLDGESYSFEP